jgi:DNA invertase Pin-like site-specific DNA recombinase
VSTHDQSVDLQMDALRDLCARRGWAIVAEFVDEGVSGAKESRPGLDALLDLARRRGFDILVFWKLDRIARSVTHLLRIVDELQTLGIDFFSVTESLDTTTPQGRMILVVLGAIAEFERSLTQERIRAGMRAAKARGVKMGRPRLEPTEKEREELVELRQSGLSIRKIASMVSWFPSNDGAARHPSPSLVHRILKEMGDPLKDGDAR